LARALALRAQWRLLPHPPVLALCLPVAAYRFRLTCVEDAFDGPQATESLALIYAWTGEFDEAFRLLDHLLVIPNFNLTVPILKLDPSWDPLRSDSRFQALIEKHSAKI